MLGCDIVDEVHIARKQYLDGSIPTGFQRTAIVGVNGRLPFRGRELSITQVSVEEDSCREVSDRGHLIVWRTDRLGMPLIETVTGPDLRTPEEVEEAILLDRPRLPLHRPRPGRHRRQPPGRQRLGARRPPRRDQGRPAGAVGAAARPRRGGAPGQPAPAARRAAPPRLHRAADVADHERGRDRPLRAPRDLGFLRRGGLGAAGSARRTPPGLRARGRATSASARCASTASPARSPTRPSPTTPSPTSSPAASASSPASTSGRSSSTARSGRTTAARLAGAAPRARSACAATPTTRSSSCGGPRRTRVTAVDEIRLRYVDATDGVPNETRQPFPDGSTDFERILPGPDRMYPDTDSPPTPRHARARRAACGAELCRRAAVGARGALPRGRGAAARRSHYLIRRGGAALVDRVVSEAGADLRDGCFLFGESASRGCGAPASPSTRSRPSAGSSCSRCSSDRPVLAESVGRCVVRQLAACARHARPRTRSPRPALGESPAAGGTPWPQRLASADAETRRERRAIATSGSPWRRAMAQLRGGVPAAEVRAALRRAHRRCVMSETRDELKGYKGRARAQARRAGRAGVERRPRVTNDAGSRSSRASSCRARETLDDVHVVIKLRNGYNVGVHVDRIRSVAELGYKEAIYKIPEKEFPSAADAAERHAARHRRHDRVAPRLPHRRGDPGVHAGRALRRRAGAGRHLQPDDQEAVRRLLREHGEGALHRPGRGDRRGDRGGRRRHRHRPRHRHHGPHGRDPAFMVQDSPGADRHGRQPALAATGPRPTRRSTSSTPSAPRPTATSPRC